MRRLAMMLLPWRSYQVGLHVTKKLGSIKRLWQIVQRKPALCVSGFVSYQMVRDANEARKSGFGSLLSLGHSPGKTDRIHMKGPGGRGEVEVAVSRVVDCYQILLFAGGWWLMAVACWSAAAAGLLLLPPSWLMLAGLLLLQCCCEAAATRCWSAG